MTSDLKNVLMLQVAVECTKLANETYQNSSEAWNSVKSLYYDITKTLDNDVYTIQRTRADDIRSRLEMQLEQTVNDDYIICLEDGIKLKTLKRHLKAKYNMTVNDYKRKWNLPLDYPVVCKKYSALRSQIASSNGLSRGKKRVASKVINFVA